MPEPPATIPFAAGQAVQRQPPTGRLLLAAVGALTLLGFAIRLANFDQSLLGDELSTYWIINGHSLGDVLSSVRSNDEITPPLYFILGWLSLKIGSDPEWVRLPSLLAGTATIPLVYMLGARTVGRAAGLLAAAVFALSPFMIYYSDEARSYALMIALLTASTLALLIALESGRARWWAVYAACSCGALLSHYTCVFPLAAQFALGGLGPSGGDPAAACWRTWARWSGSPPGSPASSPTTTRRRRRSSRRCSRSPSARSGSRSRTGRSATPT